MLWTKENIIKIMNQNEGFREGTYTIRSGKLFNDSIECNFEDVKRFVMERLQTLIFN